MAHILETGEGNKKQTNKKKVLGLINFKKKKKKKKECQGEYLCYLFLQDNAPRHAAIVAWSHLQRSAQSPDLNPIMHFGA